MVKVGGSRWTPEATAAVSGLPQLVSLFCEPLVSSHPPSPPPSLSVRSENNCFLYGVFNGYDGNRVTSFVAQRLSAELLLGQLSAEHAEADVRRVLLQVAGLGLVDRDPRESGAPGAQPYDCKVHG